MWKKLLATAAAITASAAIAFSANLPLITTPVPASDVQSALNTLIRSINGAVGRIGAGTTAVSTTATTAETTLQQYTLPGASLAAAGDSIRVTCWGGTGADSNNKTMKLYFGSSVVTTPTAGTNNKGWWLDMIVTRRTATTQAVLGRGLVDTTAVTPMVTDGAETLSAGVLVKCTGTNGTASASDITASGLIVEAVK